MNYNLQVILELLMILTPLLMSFKIEKKLISISLVFLSYLTFINICNDERIDILSLILLPLIIYKFGKVSFDFIFLIGFPILIYVFLDSIGFIVWGISPEFNLYAILYKIIMITVYFVIFKNVKINKELKLKHKLNSPLFLFLIDLVLLIVVV